MLIQKNDATACKVCRSKKRAMIDRDIRADPRAIEIYAITHKIDAIDLVRHAEVCLREPFLSLAASSEDFAGRLEARARELLGGTLDPQALRTGMQMAQAALDLRSRALTSRGVTGTEVALVKSPAFKVFLRELMRGLSDPRFKADDYSALRFVQDLCNRAQGGSDGA